MDYDSIQQDYLLETCEQELAGLNKAISIHMNAKVKTEHNRSQLAFKLIERDRIMSSVPVYGMYCHIASKTTVIK